MLWLYCSGCKHYGDWRKGVWPSSWFSLLKRWRSFIECLRFYICTVELLDISSENKAVYIFVRDQSNKSRGSGGRGTRGSSRYSRRHCWRRKSERLACLNVSAAQSLSASLRKRPKCCIAAS